MSNCSVRCEHVKDYLRWLWVTGQDDMLAMLWISGVLVAGGVGWLVTR